MYVCVCERERKREKERERLASRSQIVWRAKERVTAAADSRELTVQGDISRRFDDRASSIWAKALWEVPEKVMKFTLSAVQDILPHNANLHLWKKLSSLNCLLCSNRQTLLHTLNHCPVALQSMQVLQPAPRHSP